MAVFSKELLSASVGGRSIRLNTTATPGTLLHATGTSSSIKDEVWLWAANSHTADLKVTVEFGDVSAPDDIIEITIPAESGPVLIIPGWILSGTGAAARNVRAFCASSGLVVCNGFVNRIT